MANEKLIKGRQWLLSYHRQLLLALICSGLIYSLAEHSYRIVDDLMFEPPEPVAQNSDQRTKPMAITDFQLLFGRADEKTKQLRASDIPATSLNLTLRGALAGPDNTTSSAIIQGSDGQDHLYKVGETIPGGAVLDSVHPQYVVISYNGRLQKLLFPEAARNDKTVQGFAAPQAKSQSLPPGPLRGSQARDSTEKGRPGAELREQMEQLNQQISH